MFRYRVTGEIYGLQVGDIIEQDHEIARGFRRAVERIESDKPIVVAKPEGLQLETPPTERPKKPRGRPKKVKADADKATGDGVSGGESGQSD